MFRYLYRQRRRLLFTAFFGTLAVMTLALSRAGGLTEMTASPWVLAIAIIAISLALAVSIIAAGAVALLLVPSWRQLLEMTAFNVFIYSVLSALVPSLFDVPFLGTILPFVLWMTLYAMIYGELLDRFRIWLDHFETRSFFSEKPAEQLWKELVPGAGSVADHWDALLHELEQDLDDPDSYDVKYTHGASLYEHQTMTFLETDAPTYAKYYHVGQVDPSNQSLVEGTYEIRITPREGTMGCEVVLSSRMNAMLPRVALGAWFDDALGDRTDHLRARDTGKRDWSMTGLYRRRVMKYA